MRVISKKRLRQFWERHRESRSVLEAFYRVVNDKKLTWTSFHDVKRTYSRASQVGDCVVFDIGGNHFRLIAKIDYRSHRVLVRAVLTHKDYDLGKWKEDCNCR